MLKISFLLNQPRDIPLILTLVETAPATSEKKIIITNFNALDEFNWAIKRKSLDRYFNDEHVNSLKSVYADSVVECVSKSEFKSCIAGSDVCISKGREFFTIKTDVKKNIAVSSDCCYINRLLDAYLFYYGPKRLKIVLDSERWFSHMISKPERSCHVDLIFDRIFLEAHKDAFTFADVLGSIYSNRITENIKTEFKEQHGIPKDRKIAFLSLRSADRQITMHSDHDSFVSTTKKLLATAKQNNMFVISRRRLAQYDLTTRSGYPEIDRFDEFKDMIDLEMNGFGQYPSAMWKCLSIADCLLLPDHSSIADTEAALCMCPTIIDTTFASRFDIQTVSLLTSRRYADFMQSCVHDLASGRKISEMIRTNDDKLQQFTQRWYTTDLNKFWHSVESFVNE